MSSIFLPRHSATADKNSTLLTPVMLALRDRSSGYLFCSFDLLEAMNKRQDAIRKEVVELEPNRLLNTSPDDLAHYFAEKYAFQIPRLRRDLMSAEDREADVDTLIDSVIGYHGGRRTRLVRCQQFEIEVPFEGHENLFFARPSTFNLSPPKVRIVNGSLRFIYNILHDSPHNDIAAKVEAELRGIEGWLSTMTGDLHGFDGLLFGIAGNAIDARRKQLLLHQGRAASLGIPLKSRPGSPLTHPLPQIQRKIAPTLPAASSSPYKPEPSIDLKQYDDILSVLQGMTLAMERSPSTFRTMGEEDIRQIFLVGLNGQFVGGATGETFNVNGKTDILIREGDRNVSIAECKFWKGAKHYRESIDQLLGYKAWRDTKTAILVFNRGVAMSTVCEAVERETVKHPNFKRQDPWRRETGYRYVFHHTGDANREFLLTVLVFDVPGPNESTPAA